MNEVEAKVKNNGEGDAAWSEAPGRETGAAGGSEPGLDASLRSFRNEAEIHAIKRALERTGWNRKRAAKSLSISYRCLLYKIRRHNITPAVEPS
ncbi:MAG: helix-turn-helix domain-containing protein [Candidatus Sulfotelmatobacter sp.]